MVQSFNDYDISVGELGGRKILLDGSLHICRDLCRTVKFRKESVSFLIVGARMFLICLRLGLLMLSSGSKLPANVPPPKEEPPSRRLHGLGESNLNS